MNFFQENIGAIASTAILGLFSFVVTMNSDVALLKSESANRKDTDEKILKEIRFVKVHQMKMDEKITDTRERVIRLEAKTDESK